MKLKRYTYGLLLLLPMLMAACADTEFRSFWSGGEPSGNVTVYVPRMMSFTRGADASELTLTSLCFFAFPQNGKGEKLAVCLLDAGSGEGVNTSTATLVPDYTPYTLELKPGSYRFYLVANSALKSDIDDIEETDLTGVASDAGNSDGAAADFSKVRKIDFTGNYDGSLTRTQFPDGLPMSCGHDGFKASADGNYFSEPCDVTTDGELNLYADMTFSLAKVSLTVSDVVGNPISLDGISAVNLSKVSPVIENRAFRDYGSMSTEDKDIPHSEKDKTYSFYIPERLLDNSASQTVVSVRAQENDLSLSLKLGDDGTYDSNARPIPEDSKRICIHRGTHYIYKLNKNGELTLSTEEWKPINMCADFIHTYLKVSKTVAKVASLQDDEIAYETDGRGEVGFKCETVADGTTIPFVVANDSREGKLRVCVNPEIDAKDVPTDGLKGVADCFITAGNIKKLVKVDYNITPYFKITPVDTKIEWDKDGAGRTVSYEYETNIGGLLLTSHSDSGMGNVVVSRDGNTSYTSTVGSSTIELSCDNPGAARGTLTVTATSDPGTTTVHYFDAYGYAAKDKAHFREGSFRIPISITVKPQVGDYRIYFRAINDWSHFNGGTSVDAWLGGENSMTYDKYPTEDYGTGLRGNNWNDYWYRSGTYKIDADLNADNHRIYIWTQTGETSATGGSITNKQCTIVS